MQPLSLVLLSNNPTASREIKDQCLAESRVRMLAECQNSDDFKKTVLRLRPSAAICVLSGNESESVFQLITQLTEIAPETAIIAAAINASPALILGSMRAGAREFLQLPIISDELRTVVDRMSDFSKSAGAQAKSGRVVAVFSSKGGVGVSFVSANLAASMNASTLLVDLNLQAGDAASFLGLNPQYSLADFVTNRNRLDDSLMSSMVTTRSATLSVLAAPSEAHEADEIEPQHVSETLHLLSKKYEYLVLDLQHSFDPITIAALDMADDIVIVMTLDIPGIRSTKRALNVFERLGYPRGKVKVLVNRWSKNIDVELQKVEAHLDENLIGFIPNDYPRVMDSINLGRPLVETDSTSKLTLEVKRIAGLIAGDPGTPVQPRRNLLGSVFGRSRASGTLELSVVSDSSY